MPWASHDTLMTAATPHTTPFQARCNLVASPSLLVARAACRLDTYVPISINRAIIHRHAVGMRMAALATIISGLATTQTARRGRFVQSFSVHDD